MLVGSFSLAPQKISESAKKLELSHIMTHYFLLGQVANYMCAMMKGTENSSVSSQSAQSFQKTIFLAAVMTP